MRPIILCIILMVLLMEIKQLIYISEKQQWQIVLTDGEYMFLDEETILHFELIQGKQITPMLKAEIQTFEHVQMFYKHAIRYLQKRRTIKEVADFLRYKHDVTDSEIQSKVINLLIEQRYLDDFEYGKAYLHDVILFQKKSKVATLQKLKEKGITDETLTQLDYWFEEQASLCQAENENVKYLIQQQIKRLHKYNTYERNQRIIAKLSQKGYNRDTMKHLLSEYDMIDTLSDYEKEQILQKSKVKMLKMKHVSAYLMQMRKYNISTEELIDFFNHERMKHNGK